MNIEEFRKAAFAEDKMSEEGIEKSKELKGAVQRLMDNPDFKLVFEDYTITKVLVESERASLIPEQRAEYFERVICCNAFRKYIEDILSFTEE